MTTLAITHSRSLKPPPAWIFLVLAAALALPMVAASLHGDAHAEAEAIRQCFRDNGVIQIWSNSSGERLNCLVQLPDGRIGDRVIQFCKKSGWIEITSYIIGDGSLAETIRVLRAKACQQVYP